MTTKPSLSQLFPPEPPFHPEAIQVKVSDILEEPISINDSKFITSLPSEYGPPQPGIKFSFNRISDAGQGVEYSTLTSNKNIVDKVKKLHQMKLFPYPCKISNLTTRSGDRQYYDLTDV